MRFALEVSAQYQTYKDTTHWSIQRGKFLRFYLLIVFRILYSCKCLYAKVIIRMIITDLFYINLWLRFWTQLASKAFMNKPTKPKKVFSCEICTRSLSTKSNLQRHYSLKHSKGVIFWDFIYLLSSEFCIHANVSMHKSLSEWSSLISSI